MHCQHRSVSRLSLFYQKKKCSTNNLQKMSGLNIYPPTSSPRMHPPSWACTIPAFSSSQLHPIPSTPGSTHRTLLPRHGWDIQIPPAAPAAFSDTKTTSLNGRWMNSRRGANRRPKSGGTKSARHRWAEPRRRIRGDAMTSWAAQPKLPSSDAWTACPTPRESRKEERPSPS